MKHAVELSIRLVLLAFIWLAWWWVLSQPFSGMLNLCVIIGGVLLVYPVVWFGRKILDRQQSPGGVVWTTTLVHYSFGLTFGVPTVSALATRRAWPDWVLPVPVAIGWWLVVLTGAASALTVANLALKGLGAPFAIALSRRVATEWMYAWTRNPMVLATLAFGVSLGVWFQSALFVLWVLVVFAPALLFFVKVYEERELELRFGASYLAYKARTPMLWPRKPAGEVTRPALLVP